MPDVPSPALDRLELLVVVDNETDTLSSVDPSVSQLPELASLLGRVPPSGEHEGHPTVCVFDQLCVACHGLSVLVTGHRGDETRTVLFDVGPYADVWLANAERLDLDLSSIELLFLSHWHSDHSGGFPEVVGAIAAARHTAGLPAPIVDLHPDRPDQRGVQLPTGMMACLADEPTFEAIEAAGGVVQRNAEVHLVADLFVGSGLIERVTDYEMGLVGHHTRSGTTWASDPLILDERFLAARVRGRGVSLLSACSHAGVVNACIGAKALFPDEPVDTVLGGYHLAGGPMESRIDETVRDLLERVQPRIVAPGHCTGWRAKAALADAFAPGRYGPSVVGSRYILTAE
jgi:7,8-dihydropterin-6-yl-methyl-4-(beta-D-ribofuranosyl)aminobenzene 5'-phosphate synthase